MINPIIRRGDVVLDLVDGNTVAATPDGILFVTADGLVGRIGHAGDQAWRPADLIEIGDEIVLGDGPAVVTSTRWVDGAQQVWIGGTSMSDDPDGVFPAGSFAEIHIP